MPVIPRTETLVDDTAGPIMVFDGVCVFCSSGARLVHRHDRRGVQCRDPAKRPEPAIGHRKVQKHDVGCQTPGKLHRLAP